MVLFVSTFSRCPDALSRYEEKIFFRWLLWIAVVSMNRVLSFPQSHSCDDPAEVVSKRLCFSCIFSVSFFSLIGGYLLGSRPASVCITSSYKSVYINYEDMLKNSHRYSKNINDSMNGNFTAVGSNKIFELEKLFKINQFDEVSPIIVSKMVLTFKNKQMPDALEIVVDNDDVRYRNVRNASYSYVIPDDADEDFNLTNIVSGLPVYANFGLEEDFQYLLKQNISLRGCIVLLRLGRISVLEKVSNAINEGVVGILLFADPQQYPRTNCMSVETEISPILLTNLHKLNSSFDPHCRLNCGINIQIIEPVTAKTILRDMSAVNKSPSSWHGAFNVLYTTGPGFRSYSGRLVMYSYFLIVKYIKHDIIAYLRSSRDADRYVVLSNDVHNFDAKENSKEKNTFIDISKSLAEIKQKGWKPARTLIFCTFGIYDEEIYPSDSSVQRYIYAIKQRAVAYLKVEQPVSETEMWNFDVSPLLRTLLDNVSRMRKKLSVDNELKTEISHSDAEKPEIFNKSFSFNSPSLCPENSLSVQQNFENISQLFWKTKIGDDKSVPSIVPSIIVTYRNQEENGDTEINVRDFGDSVSRLWTLLAFALADRVILPFNMSVCSDLIRQLNSQIKFLYIAQNISLVDNMELFNQSVENSIAAITAFQKNMESFADLEWTKSRWVNDKLMQVEKLITCIRAPSTMLQTVINEKFFATLNIPLLKMKIKKAESCIANVSHLVRHFLY